MLRKCLPPLMLYVPTATRKGKLSVYSFLRLKSLVRMGRGAETWNTLFIVLVTTVSVAMIRRKLVTGCFQRFFFCIQECFYLPFVYSTPQINIYNRNLRSCFLYLLRPSTLYFWERHSILRRGKRSTRGEPSCHSDKMTITFSHFYAS